MEKGRIINDPKEIETILKTVKTVAVIGLSSDPDKDSYAVGKYLRGHGYEIFPIHPKADEILGRKVFKSLDELTKSEIGPVDVVDVFRPSEQIVPHAEEAIRHRPEYFWMQLGIRNEEAAQMLVSAGIDVVMDRCMKKEHENLAG